MARAEQAKRVRLVGRSNLGGWGDASQVVVQGNIACVAAIGDRGHEGTTILDVADPRRPKLLSQIPAPPGTHSHKVQLWGDLMFVNNERPKNYQGTEFVPGLRVYDISNPASPRALPPILTGGVGVHRFRIDTERGLALLPTGDEGYLDKILWILDINDPVKPRLVSKWWLPGQWTAGGEISQAAPGERFAAHGPPWIEGQYLYLGYWDAGFVILDVSDLNAPHFLSRVDWSPPFHGHTHTIVPVQGKPVALVTDEAHGTRNFERSQFLWVVDIQDHAHPVPVATYRPDLDDFLTSGGRFGAHNLFEKVTGDLAFVVWFNAGLRVVSIADPYRPTEVGFYIPESDWGEPVQSNDVFVDGRGLIYITDRWGGGLHILEYQG
ncbi:MAG TPA: hypothetical protein VLT62_23900 [Candidatus Methylomirabilis sp.]|nr:hypothetical protein [Candidatus Methylomirabilis sp.]